jgi:hypothetical protein
MTMILDGTSGAFLPTWTTATRPASPANGEIGYNSTTGQLDQYVGSAWSSVPTAGASQATATALGTVYALQTTGGGTPYLTAFGYQAGVSTTGVRNTAIGTQALFTNSTGTDCTIIGYKAGYAITGAVNIAIGSSSMTNSVGITGGYNTGIGNSTLTNLTSGNRNIGIGNEALASTTIAVCNTAIGSYNNAGGNGCMSTNTTGSYNTAMGAGALSANLSASNNTAVGYLAGYTNSTGATNTYIGYRAGVSATGSYNTFVGSGATDGAGAAITSGTKNTIVGGYTGNQSGLDIRTASNYVVLSDGDGNPVAYYKGNNQSWVFGQGGTGYTGDGNITLNGAEPALGNGASIAGQSNGTFAWAIGSYRSVISGTATWFTCANTSGGVYLSGASATSWSAVSDETRKVIIEPITDAANKVSTLRAVIGRLKTDEESVRRPYLIAQDVQAVLPEAVSENEDKEGTVLCLSYTEVIPLLVAAIKELNAKFDAYVASHP